MLSRPAGLPNGNSHGKPATTGYSSYGSLGAYAVTGTVVDPRINQPPVAAATATPASGYAPLAVTLDGSSSYDPDGAIASYAWNFGDGTTGSGAKVTHTYTAVRTYTAVLTVTDNGGAKSTKNLTIQVQATPTIRVSSISIAVTASSSGNTYQATVKVTDSAGTAVSGVTVSGTWSGAVAGTSTGSTDANGRVVLASAKTKTSGSATFTVTGLSKTGYVYNSSGNLVSAATK